MNDLEQQLRKALARKEPPPSLETKILDAVSREPQPAPPGWLHRVFAVRWRWIPAVAAGAVLVTGTVTEIENQHERALAERRAQEERRAGEIAKARLELALKITGTKLQKVREIIDATQEN